MTVRRTHHGNLDAHVAQSSDAVCPVSFDWGAPLELEAEFGKELNGGVDVFYHDADVVHTLDRHDVSLVCNAWDELQAKAVRLSLQRACRFCLSAPSLCQAAPRTSTSST